MSSTRVSVTEGRHNTFTVKLAFQPAANVTVSVARASGDTDLTVSGGASLTFTSANWNTAQTVTLAAAQDVDLANGSAVFDVTSTGLTTVECHRHRSRQRHTVTGRVLDQLCPSPKARPIPSR